MNRREASAQNVYCWQGPVSSCQSTERSPFVHWVINSVLRHVPYVQLASSRPHVVQCTTLVWTATTNWIAQSCWNCSCMHPRLVVASMHTRLKQPDLSPSWLLLILMRWLWLIFVITFYIHTVDSCRRSWKAGTVQERDTVKTSSEGSASPCVHSSSCFFFPCFPNFSSSFEWSGDKISRICFDQTSSVGRQGAAALTWSDGAEMVNTLQDHWPSSASSALSLSVCLVLIWQLLFSSLYLLFPWSSNESLPMR